LHRLAAFDSHARFDLPQGKPVGGMGKPVNQNGFSDHFPITMTVTEAD
jgi:hypothetical protein